MVSPCNPCGSRIFPEGWNRMPTPESWTGEVEVWGCLQGWTWHLSGSAPAQCVGSEPCRGRTMPSVGSVPTGLCLAQAQPHCGSLLVFRSGTTTIWFQKLSLKSHKTVHFLLPGLSKTWGLPWMDGLSVGPSLSGGQAPTGQGKARCFPDCCVAWMPGPCCPLSWALFCSSESFSGLNVD